MGLFLNTIYLNGYIFSVAVIYLKEFTYNLGYRLNQAKAIHIQARMPLQLNKTHDVLTIRNISGYGQHIFTPVTHEPKLSIRRDE